MEQQLGFLVFTTRCQLAAALLFEIFQRASKKAD